VQTRELAAWLSPRARQKRQLGSVSACTRSQSEYSLASNASKRGTAMPCARATGAATTSVRASGCASG